MDILIEEGVKFDAIITDPPYGTTACKWDSIIPFWEHVYIGKKLYYKDDYILHQFKQGKTLEEINKYWEENKKEGMWSRLNKLIKPNGAIVLFGSEPFSSMLRYSNINDFKYDWIWEKSNPSNIGNVNRQPLKYHEIISVFYKGQCTYNKQMIPRKSERIKQAQNSGYKFHNSMSEQNGLDYVEVNSLKYDKDFKNPSSILKYSSLRPNSREFVKHPTQKPTSLMECLVKTYTNENDSVLDFTMGSGSTGVACLNTSRRFVGIELDEKYFNIAKERLENNFSH